MTGVFNEMSVLWSCRIVKSPWCPVSKYKVIDFRELSKAQHCRDPAKTANSDFYKDNFEKS